MASGFTVATNTDFIRSNIYTKQITRAFEDDLFAMRFVRTITDFPDGTTLNMPRLGVAETADFAEGQAIKYNKFDTGNFTFTIDQYKYSANSISAKFKRDSFWSAEIQAAFAPEQHRALMKGFEARIFNRANSAQTASSQNTVNSAQHRWVGSGSSNSLSIKDFFLAELALRVANVPMRNLVAVVDPTCAFDLEQSTNAINLLSPMPKWGNMVNEGLVSGFQFRFSIAGFDVYVSNYLAQNIAETVNSKSVTTGVANVFFSAEPGMTTPFIAAFRQMPTVFSEFNKDLQQDEFLTITEYGVACYRPENLCIVLTDKGVRT
jgi:hypothetical protein